MRGLRIYSDHASVSSPSAAAPLTSAERVNAFKGTRLTEAGTTNAEATARRLEGVGSVGFMTGELSFG